MSAEKFVYSKELKYDFKTPEYATIAARTLNVDDDLKPDESASTFESRDNYLIFKVKAISEKHLQKAISTTEPSIDLIQRTISEFALDK